MSRLAKPISLSAPPMTPAMATAREASAITHISFASVRSALSSVLIFSPWARPAHDDPLCGASLIEIESVHGLAQLEHYIIGDVDDVVDRFLIDRLEALPQPVRRRPHLHAAHHAGRVAATKFRRLNFHAGRSRNFLRRFP